MKPEVVGPDGVASLCIESLSDGIYAVALTLLVLELRLPELPATAADAAVAAGLATIVPKLLTWLISFLFLASFWFGLHRVLRQTHALDRRLAVIVLGHLMLVCIAPFVVAVFGAHTETLTAQLLYNGLLAGMSVSLLAMVFYLDRHAALAAEPMHGASRRALLIRLWSLVFCAGCASAIAAVDVRYFGLGYLWMPVAGIWARRTGRAARGSRPRAGGRRAASD